MDFIEACAESKKIAFSFSNPLIVHHYDTDGITSGAIVCAAFLENNKKFRRLCIKKLDDIAIDKLSHEKEIIFVDLGGGNKRVNELKDVVILDHHQTTGIEKFQINPHLYGIDGSTEMSASGVAYFVFKTKIELAITGAVGDMQAPFVGKNRELLDIGEKEGRVRREQDLCFYGRYSRPLVQFLEYNDEPYIPGISYREDKCINLLQSLRIEIKKGEKYRTYADLTKEEKKALVSALADILIERGKIKSISELIGESYVFTNHQLNESYEAGEFSTLLNACGRHKRDDIGIGVALGNEKFFDEARKLLHHHRVMLKNGVEHANTSLQNLGPFYLIDGREMIDESIIGIVCGMVNRSEWGKPVLGIARSEKGQLKASVRGKGKNLGLAIKKAAEKCGGVGGGHTVAAGASFPEKNLDDFILFFAEELNKQN
ncbi:MAG: DHH family phosphoesterase [Candidatus Bilamarchaeaceae archaeon]